MSKFKCQKGLTLIELLASIVIISFIAIFATSLFINALKNYANISSDTVLRDEADLIIAQLTKEVYTSKDSEITFTQDTNSGDYYISKKADSTQITGFKNNKIFINGKEYNLNSKDLVVLWDECNITMFENQNLDRSLNITLTLKTTKKNIKRTFKTEVRTINDLILEKEDE